MSVKPMPNSPMAWLERAGRAALRFLLAPGYATTLRASELVSASFGDIGRDDHGDHWLHCRQARRRRIATARTHRALRCADTREFRCHAARREPRVEKDRSIESTRLWRVLWLLFILVTDAIQDKRHTTAEKQHRTSPRGRLHARVASTSVRRRIDHSARPAPCIDPTTSTYLRNDAVQRARSRRLGMSPIRVYSAIVRSWPRTCGNSLSTSLRSTAFSVR